MPARKRKNQDGRDRPLEARLRAIFGATGDEPMPRFVMGPLRELHAHPAANLAFPFEGRWFNIWT